VRHSDIVVCRVEYDMPRPMEDLLTTESCPPIAVVVTIEPQKAAGEDWTAQIAIRLGLVPCAA